MKSMRPSRLLLAFIFLPVAVLFQSSASAQTVEEILAKVITARGGLAKIRSIHSERVSGKITFGDVSGPFVVEFKRPLKMHMQLTIQNQTMVRVYDGQSQGWANNPFAGKANPEPMTEDDLKNISEESDFDGPLVDYKKKGNQIELVGKDKVNDKDVWRMKLTTKNGDVRSYLFDANSFLLLKWEGKRKADGQEMPVESYFSDYRDVGGMKFAYAIDSGSSAADIAQKIRIEKTELNPELNDAEFTKPATPEQPGSPPPTPAQPPAAPPQSRLLRNHEPSGNYANRLKGETSKRS
jgi:outer membrane lipoprotein-sorting protein